MDRSFTLPKVFTWGTFDGLHEGHKEFLKRVAQFGKLHVIVIPSAKKFENSGYYPVKTEDERRSDLLHFGKVENDNLIEDVFIDCFDYGLKSLITIQPDIFCFGYDQDADWDKGLIKFIKEQKMNTTLVRMLTQNGNGVHSSHRHKISSM